MGGRQRKNLTGKTFERWTVISYDGNDKWKCECSCEDKTVKSIITYNLTHNRSLSCGCHKRKISIGDIFGFLTVTRRADAGRWGCQCSCGSEEKLIYTCHLMSGDTKSCGCYQKEVSSKVHKTHGLRKSVEYTAWSSIKNRCYRKTYQNYSRYGGRGIRVCERWLNSFENFLNDMGERPSKEYSIERKDNNGNYSPENCKWGTREEQNSNKITNRHITYNGKTQTVTRWANELGINRQAIYHRLDAGWPVDKIFSTPIKVYNYV